MRRCIHSYLRFLALTHAKQLSPPSSSSSFLFLSSPLPSYNVKIHPGRITGGTSIPKYVLIIKFNTLTANVQNVPYKFSKIYLALCIIVKFFLLCHSVSFEKTVARNTQSAHLTLPTVLALSAYVRHRWRIYQTGYPMPTTLTKPSRAPFNVLVSTLRIAVYTLQYYCSRCEHVLLEV